MESITRKLQQLTKLKKKYKLIYKQFTKKSASCFVNDL